MSVEGNPVGKDYVVLGFGNIGRNIVHDLVENNRDGRKISVYDPFIEPGEFNISGVTLFRSDPFAERVAEKIFNRDTVVISALPPKLMERAYELAMRFGGNLIDIASVHRDITDLLENKSEFLIIPEFGIAPGITNLLVGHFVSELKEVDDIKIYVGGIPNKPIPPLEYKITWSPTALVNMYLNPVEIYQDGLLKIIEPLTGVEEFEIDGFDYPLEAFYTDGLSTLKYTMKNVKNMFEKTVRYRGHAEKISLLKNLGYLGNEEITLSAHNVRPRDVTEALLNQKLKTGEIGDTLLLRVVAEGKKGGKRVKSSATLVYSVDANVPFTAMSHTTGFPPSILAQMISSGELEGLRGYLPPQELGSNKKVFGKIMQELAKRGIKISIKENEEVV